MVTLSNQDQVETAPTLRHARGWAWFVVVSAIAMLGCYALPVFGLDGVLSLATPVFAAASVAAVVAGTAAYRPTGRLPWLLLAGAQLLYVIADGANIVNVHARHDTTFPALQDAFHLARFPVLVVALAILTWRRTPGWRLTSLIDAAVVATGVALVWWVYLISPMTAAGELSPLGRAVGIAYPVLDLLVLTIALRLVLGAGDRSPAVRLLLASTVLVLVGDTAYAVQRNAGTWADGTWIDALRIGSYVLLGAAALHPSMRWFDRPILSGPRDGAPARLAGLAAAALLAPAVLLIQDLRGTPTHLPAIALSCAALFLLVLLRMAGTLRAQQRVAMTDSLTGLHARRFFEEALVIEAQRASRGEAFVSILLIDIDKFKRINDTYGHPSGDLVLREVASRLRDGCRPGDVIARYGGEEFAVLLPDASPTQASQVAERIRDQVCARPLPLDDNSSITVTVSLGAVTLPGDGTCATDVIRTADRALYAAKRAGRNRVITGRALNPPALFADCGVGV